MSRGQIDRRTPITSSSCPGCSFLSSTVQLQACSYTATDLLTLRFCCGLSALAISSASISTRSVASADITASIGSAGLLSTFARASAPALSLFHA
jgi:hypothetical protein